MKVLYKNKVGILFPTKTAIYCDNCIYHSNYTSISRCKKVGLMQLCVSPSKYYEFISSSSDLLTYEIKSK